MKHVALVAFLFALSPSQARAEDPMSSPLAELRGDSTIVFGKALYFPPRAARIAFSGGKVVQVLLTNPQTGRRRATGMVPLDKPSCLLELRPYGHSKRAVFKRRGQKLIVFTASESIDRRHAIVSISDDSTISWIVCDKPEGGFSLRDLEETTGGTLAVGMKI